MGSPSRFSENRSGVGANIEYVPVPVLGRATCHVLTSRGTRRSACRTHRSGRCSPLSRISRTRSRYWYSSCLLAGDAGMVPFVGGCFATGVVAGSLGAAISVTAGVIVYALH